MISLSLLQGSLVGLSRNDTQLQAIPSSKQAPHQLCPMNFRTLLPPPRRAVIKLHVQLYIAPIRPCPPIADNLYIYTLPAGANEDKKHEPTHIHLWMDSSAVSGKSSAHHLQSSGTLSLQVAPFLSCQVNCRLCDLRASRQEAKSGRRTCDLLFGQTLQLNQQNLLHLDTRAHCAVRRVSDTG